MAVQVGAAGVQRARQPTHRVQIAVGEAPEQARVVEHQRGLGRVGAEQLEPALVHLGLLAERGQREHAERSFVLRQRHGEHRTDAELEHLVEVPDDQRPGPSRRPVEQPRLAVQVHALSEVGRHSPLHAHGEKAALRVEHRDEAALTVGGLDRELEQQPEEAIRVQRRPGQATSAALASADGGQLGAHEVLGACPLDDQGQRRGHRVQAPTD
jgi:hypothetical protein